MCSTDRCCSTAAELDVAFRVEEEPERGDHPGVELEELGEAAGAPGQLGVVAGGGLARGREELEHLEVPQCGHEADHALAERLGADPVPGDRPFEDEVCGEDGAQRLGVEALGAGLGDLVVGLDGRCLCTGGVGLVGSLSDRCCPVQTPAEPRSERLLPQLPSELASSP